ncbi:hypothetical protein BDZ45DRAFT_745477 [Acephala macrosclerotiorum]|nr:hypothetical protein BDZ45DRAFT_745477 [Acephala macrosclerotiorum]
MHSMGQGPGSSGFAPPNLDFSGSFPPAASIEKVPPKATIEALMASANAAFPIPAHGRREHSYAMYKGCANRPTYDKMYEELKARNFEDSDGEEEEKNVEEEDYSEYGPVTGYPPGFGLPSPILVPMNSWNAYNYCRTGGYRAIRTNTSRFLELFYYTCEYAVFIIHNTVHFTVSPWVWLNICFRALHPFAKPFSSSTDRSLFVVNTHSVIEETSSSGVRHLSIPSPPAAAVKKVTVKKPAADPAKKGVGKVTAPKNVTMEASKAKEVLVADSKAKAKGTLCMVLHNLHTLTITFNNLILFDG